MKLASRPPSTVIENGGGSAPGGRPNTPHRGAPGLHLAKRLRTRVNLPEGGQRRINLASHFFVSLRYKRTDDKKRASRGAAPRGATLVPSVPYLPYFLVLPSFGFVLRGSNQLFRPQARVGMRARLTGNFQNGRGIFASINPDPASTLPPLHPNRARSAQVGVDPGYSFSRPRWPGAVWTPTFCGPAGDGRA